MPLDLRRHEHRVIARLIARRARIEMSQEELEHRIGVASGHVAKWETGRASPSLHLLTAWCAALRCELVPLPASAVPPPPLRRHRHGSHK